VVARSQVSPAFVAESFLCPQGETQKQSGAKSCQYNEID
jgi:hypothetical protein